MTRDECRDVGLGKGAGLHSNSGGLILTAGTLLLLNACQFVPGTSAHQEEKAKRLAAEFLIDPTSAQYQNVISREDAICGEINGKNRMGAYAGYTRFLVKTADWSVQLDPKFDFTELASAESMCTSMRSNSYSSADTTSSVCSRAEDQRIAQIEQASFDTDWAASCGPIKSRGVYRPRIGGASEEISSEPLESEMGDVTAIDAGTGVDDVEQAASDAQQAADAALDNAGAAINDAEQAIGDAE